MPPLKNARQELFCVAYADHGHRMTAYVNAGYRGKTRANGSFSGDAACVQLLKNSKVRARLAELQQQRVRRYDVTRDWVVRRLRVNVNRALQAVPVRDRTGKLTGEWQYEGHVANKSLELLGKDIGMWPDKQLEKGGDTINLTQYNFYMPDNHRSASISYALGNGHATGEGNGGAT